MTRERDRGVRPPIGTAVSRPPADLTGWPFHPFGPWGRWTPWYGTGFGWNVGYVIYSPRYYAGGTSWVWGRHGLWYNPFAYDPFYPYYLYDAYDPYGYAPAPAPARTRGEPPVRRATGSVRLKASPETARVYIDGVLVGTVDDFNGLTGHLELETGTHRLELRADGYETLAKDITVQKDRTITERLSLKKSKKQA